MHVELKRRHAVSKSGLFTHEMTFYHDVPRKRFNTHRESHNMEKTISKDHVAEKPRRGASMGDIYITMITSRASCRDAATAYFVTD